MIGKIELLNETLSRTFVENKFILFYSEKLI